MCVKYTHRQRPTPATNERGNTAWHHGWLALESGQTAAFGSGASPVQRPLFVASFLQLSNPWAVSFACFVRPGCLVNCCGSSRSDSDLRDTANHRYHHMPLPARPDAHGSHNPFLYDICMALFSSKFFLENRHGSIFVCI